MMPFHNNRKIKKKASTRCNFAPKGRSRGERKIDGKRKEREREELYIRV